MHKIFRIFKYLETVQTSICILMLIFMSLLVVVQVLSRYLFNYSFVWAEELVRYLMIWMVMIGAALVQSKNEHIRIDFFTMLAGPRGRRIMETIFRLFTLLFLTILVFKGIKIASFNRLFESSGLRITMFWPTMALPLGAFMMGIYTGSALIRDVVQVLFWPAERLLEEEKRLTTQKEQANPVSHQGNMH